MISGIGNIGLVKKESLDGKYQAACVLNAGYIYISSDFGLTWVQRAYNEQYKSVAISGDGKYVTIIMATSGYIRNSSDYGVSYGGAGPADNWESIDMSYDGKYQLAVSGHAAYLSTNYGVSWSQKLYGQSVERGAVSATGLYQVVGGGGGSDYINVSANSGSTFAHWMRGGTYEQTGNFTDVAISGDGAIKVFASRSDPNTIRVMGDITQYNFNPTYKGQPKVAISYDGKYVTAAFSGYYIYRSTDYGVTFSPNYSYAANWTGVSMSASGKYQTITRQDNTILRSVDYGVTWQSVAGTSRYYSDVYVGKSL